MKRVSYFFLWNLTYDQVLQFCISSILELVSDILLSWRYYSRHCHANSDIHVITGSFDLGRDPHFTAVQILNGIPYFFLTKCHVSDSDSVSDMFAKIVTMILKRHFSLSWNFQEFLCRSDLAADLKTFASEQSAAAIVLMFLYHVPNTDDITRQLSVYSPNGRLRQEVLTLLSVVTGTTTRSLC